MSKRPKKIHARGSTDNQAICGEINDPRVKRTVTSIMADVNCQSCLQKLKRKSVGG
jgi:hypothetical protein